MLAKLLLFKEKLHGPPGRDLEECLMRRSVGETANLFRTFGRIYGQIGNRIYGPIQNPLKEALQDKYNAH